MTSIPTFIVGLHVDVEPPTSVKDRNGRLQVDVGLTTLNQRMISVGKATVELPFFSRRWARYGITTDRSFFIQRAIMQLQFTEI
jgi:hypothetical protein